MPDTKVVNRRRSAMLGLFVAAAMTVSSAASPWAASAADDVRTVGPACDATLQNLWQTSLAGFTAAPCTVPPPVSIPTLGTPASQQDAAQRCLATQLATMAAADDEAGRRYRVNLLRELLEQQGVSEPPGQSEPPNLADLVTDAMATPEDLLQAMLEAAGETGEETQTKTVTCGVALDTGGRDNSQALATQNQPTPPQHVSTAGTEPVTVVAYIRNLIAHLKQDTLQVFKRAVTVAVGAAYEPLSRTVRWEARITVRKVGLSPDDDVAVTAETNRVEALLKSLGFNVQRSFVDPARGLVRHAEEDIVIYERGRGTADLVVVGATNRICENRCWAVLQPNQRPKVFPATEIAGDPMTNRPALEIWTFSNVQRRLANAGPARQRTVVDDLTTIINQSGGDLNKVFRDLFNY